MGIEELNMPKYNYPKNTLKVGLDTCFRFHTFFRVSMQYCRDFIRLKILAFEYSCVCKFLHHGNKQVLKQNHNHT